MEHPQYGQFLRLILRIFSTGTNCGAGNDFDAVAVPRGLRAAVELIDGTNQDLRISLYCEEGSPVPKSNNPENLHGTPDIAGSRRPN